MKTGVVQSAFIANTTRLDGGFHLSEGITVRSLIAKSPYSLVKIGEVTESVYCPGIFHRNYVSSGTPFLGGADIQKMDYDTGKYLRESTTPNHEILAVKKDWTLVTCGGTIGETAYVNEDLAKCWLSQHIMRVIPSVSKIKEGFLYAYLASKQGKSLLTTSTYGSVIPTLNAGSIKQIPIPQFPEEFQNKIDAQIKDAAALRVEANKLLEEAKRKVEEFVGGEPERKKSVTVSSQRIFQSFGKRFEANYHISTGSELEDYIKDKFEYKLLGDVCKSISRPEIFKRNYVKNGVMFLGGADIMLATPDSGKYLSRKTPNIDALAVQEDWILIPRSGTIGDVVYTHSEHAQKLVSEHVIRACPNNILSSGYIYAFLSSKVGKALIQRYIFGSVIQHVESPHLSRIPIPLMSEKEMTEIDSSIKKYKDNVGKAIRLERSAIKAVEDEIDSWGK